jgi:hypothetical protein
MTIMTMAMNVRLILCLILVTLLSKKNQAVLASDERIAVKDETSDHVTVLTDRLSKGKRLSRGKVLAKEVKDEEGCLELEFKSVKIYEEVRSRKEA